MQKAVEDLKKQPKEERTAVAGGVAVLVMTALFVGWGFFFLKKITRGEVETEWGPRTDVVDFSNLQEATQEFSGAYFDATEELKRIRDEAATRSEAQLESEHLEDISGGYYIEQIGPEGDAFGL